MMCPFLQTKSVKYCGLCRLTMIPLDGDGQAHERCSGPGYRTCALALARRDGPLPADGCPFLRVGEVRCCAASTMQKLIPCSDTAVSRCTDEGHRHCPLFLAMAEPAADDDGAGDAPLPGLDADDETPLPESLALAGNHMWLDHRGGRTCHVGIDAFFGRTLGRIDAVRFPGRRGDGRPAVRISAGGVDFDLVFPHALQEAEANAHLAVDPRDALRDPYGRGWLFEGIVPGRPATDGPRPLLHGLLQGDAARRWLRRERVRLARFVHERLLDDGDDATPLIQDGGFPCLPLADVLSRAALVRLHAEFFAQPTGGIDP